MNRRRTLLVFAMILLLSAALPVYGQRAEMLPSGLPYGSLGASIEEMFRANEPESAALAVAVFNPDGILYRNSLGYQDKEKQLPADESTVYEWGSISKLLVAVSVMQLWEEGLIDLDEDIQNYLPPGYLSNLSYPDKVTITDLLNHKGGFQEGIADLFVADRTRVTSLGGALKEHPPAQIYRPGTVAAYSNWGIALAGYIVELVTGIPYHEYVRNSILNPLAMENTAVAVDLSDNPWVASQRQKLQGYDTNGKLMRNTRFYIPLYPAGSATGTLEDLVKFARALPLPATGESRLFKERATHERLLTATSWYGASGIPSNAHGLWSQLKAVRVMGHSGNTQGSTSTLLFQPETGLGAVVLTNQNMDRYYSEGIMEKVFGTFTDSPQADTERTLPEGLYRTARTIKQGPLSIYSALMLPMTEKDMDSFWAVDTSDGFTRVVYPYGDMVRVEPREAILTLILVSLLAAGILYALGTLIIGGLILTPLSRRKARRTPGGASEALYPLKKSNYLTSALILLWAGNAIFLAVRIFTFTPSSNYLWQIGLNGLIALVMIILLIYYMAPVRQKNLRTRDRVKTVLAAVFLTAAITAIFYWQMYAFWAI